MTKTEIEDTFEDIVPNQTLAHSLGPNSLLLADLMKLLEGGGSNDTRHVLKDQTEVCSHTVSG